MASIQLETRPNTSKPNINNSRREAKISKFQELKLPLMTDKSFLLFKAIHSKHSLSQGPTLPNQIQGVAELWVQVTAVASRDLHLGTKTLLKTLASISTHLV